MDSISRQAAIDAKQEFRNPNVVRSTEARTAYDRTYANGWNDCNSAWIDVVKDLPSAQPEHNPDDERKIADLHKMVNYLLSQLEQRWIPCSERLPEDLEEVNVTWINHIPEPYYDFLKDKSFTGSAVYYRGGWYWYSSRCTDILAEYGTNGMDKVDDGIEITAWMPLPETWEEGEQG